MEFKNLLEWHKDCVIHGIYIRSIWFHALCEFNYCRGFFKFICVPSEHLETHFSWYKNIRQLSLCKKHKLRHAWTEDHTIKPLYLKDSEIQYSDNGKKGLWAHGLSLKSCRQFSALPAAPPNLVACLPKRRSKPRKTPNRRCLHTLYQSIVWSKLLCFAEIIIVKCITMLMKVFTI